MSLPLFFIAAFGMAWLTLLRASDANTERFVGGTRETVLVFGAFAWVLLFGWFAASVHGGDWRREAAPIVAAVSGFLTSVAIYLLAARRFPGFMGARALTYLPPLEELDKPPEKWAEWLFLDLRNVPKALRLRAARRR